LKGDQYEKHKKIRQEEDDQKEGPIEEDLREQHNFVKHSARWLADKYRWRLSSLNSHEEQPSGADVI
jgi:hypothetical protein